MPGNTYLEMLEPDEARKLWFTRIMELCMHPGIEKVNLLNCAGRIVAAPVAAVCSSPAFHGAAMDGIAVDASKTYSASIRHPLRLETGKDAFWINTGRPLPAGTNAVIMVENVNSEEDGRFVVVEKAAFPWQHVRKAGEDMVATEIVLAPGVRIGPFELGALAATGVQEITVFKKPVVAIIPSGNEIIPLNEADAQKLASGQYLPEFNSLVLAEMIKEGGGIADILPIVPDDPVLIAKAVKDAAASNCNLVILNAGASAGSHDFSAQIIRECGERIVHGIKMMPGKPTALGIVKQNGVFTPVIGTPGYPVSAIMAMEEFVLPLLEMWHDRPAPEYEYVEALPCNPIPSRPGMEERIRVKLGVVDGKYHAISLPRGAGTVSSLSRADAIIAIPPNSEGLNAGEPVRARLLRSKAQIGDALLAVGSHDNTLDLIDGLLRKKHPKFRLTSAHVGSLGGLMALARGQCHLSGSHLLDSATGIYNQAAIRQQLKGIPVCLVRLVDREQGLILKPGNPCAIKSLADLARNDIRFVNRQKGSGTRVLLDYKLSELGISPHQIQGYGDEEYTHMNVASAVLSGQADVGLGARSAANALGLEFLPVAMEDYDFVIPDKYMIDARVIALLEVVRSEEFKNAALKMGGYGVERTGEIIWKYDGI